MNEIIYAMVEYAERSRMPMYLAEDNRCRESQRTSAQQIQQLRDMLPEDGQHRLEELLSELMTIEGAKMEAMFLAGFSLGQELSRL